MKAKRRSSKSQPIRKRKKAKQVLARVAERKEIREQKLERKLAEADARLNAARLASLSIPTGQSSQREDTQTSQQTPRQKGPLIKSSTARTYAHSDGDYDGTDDDDDDDIDCVEERQHAFSQLVGNLTKPLHSSSSTSKQNFTKSKKQSSKQQRKSNGSEISEHDAATEETNNDRGKPSTADKKQLRGVESKVKQSDLVEILYTNVDTENRAAALRENEHFSHALKTAAGDPEKSVLVASTYKTIAEWPRLRLLASASIGDKAEKNLRDLTAQEQQPISLGTQLTTLRRWQTHPSFNLMITEQVRTPLVRGFAASIRAFHDVLVCAGARPHIESALRSLYVAHCVSHVLRCRARVLRNNAFVNEKQDGVDDENDDIDDDDGDGDSDSTNKDPEKSHIIDEDALRDRGFVRARVLILVPMRNVAYDVVKQILLLAGGDLTPDDPDDDDAKSNKERTKKKKKNGIQIMNYERFDEEFRGDDEGDLDEEVDDDDDMELDGGTGRVQNSKRYHGMQDMDETLRTKTTLSKEHSRIFRGNVDDDFKLGISLSKKAIKLFADFYESDFIIASPLGLRRSSAAKATGQDKHSRAMREKRKKDEDTEWKSGIDSQVERKDHNKDANDNGFLSSIEVCVIDGAHILSMQNWDTLQRTLAMVNNMPTCTRDTDFSRVRDYCLDGHMNRFRQTLVLSRYRKSDTMALFRQLANHSGKVQLVEIPPEQGVMSCVAHPIRQTFFKVPLPSSTSSALLPSIAPDERLRFFFAQTLPAIRALTEAQTLVVVPSYFDFVRVRNRLVELQQEDPALRFSSMCEYSRARDVVRTRSMLFDRSLSLVVVTERFHFFWRHWIRGVDTIVWYGLPDNCQFYPELLNMTEEAADNDRTVQSLALYDQFDVFALERIVGPGRCRRMISKTARSTYMFV